eukprot:TRINITY_DN4352_c0_g1_i2.p1 TRINITY_DN4352_c0_g1~~TRINITY_DN4352_c0_g1_i2.p1  ORF type:complete len:742 (-),score=199.86 TRINITY_DN4352_c0_g1_i2:78-2171(-)
MFKGWWLFALGVLALMFAVTRILYRYADFKRIGWWPVLIVWIGWTLNFGIVLLVPLDIANAKHERCINQVRAEWNTTHPTGETLQEEIEAECGGGPWVEVKGDGLMLFWQLIYWITYVLCWTAFPITQSFCMTGEFYFFERLRAAIRLNFIFYCIYGAIGLVGLFVLILSGANLSKFNSLEAIRNVAVAASNSYGMFLMVAFLGYSLVETPAFYWRHSNDEKMLKYYYFLAVRYREQYEKGKNHLDKVMKHLKVFDEKIQSDDPFRPLVDVVISQTPPEYRDIFLGEGSPEVTYDKLVGIHHDLKAAIHETLSARSLYINCLNRTFRLEDIVNSKTSDKKIVEWEFKQPRTGSFAGFLNRLEWIWYTYLHQWVFLGISFLGICMGLIIVWNEEVLGFREKFKIKTELGIFAQMLKNEHDSYPFEVQWLFVFLPLAYIASCCYSSLFKINFFGIYRLIPHHQSDAPSLLFNSMYIARLTFPIAYNFMLMSRTVPLDRKEVCDMGVYENANGVCALNTQFSKLYARPILAMPEWIQDMNILFPIVMLVLCVLTFFDVYTKFILNCCLKSVQKFFGIYDDKGSGAQIQQGKDLVETEKQRKRNGETWTIDSVGLQQTGRFNLSGVPNSAPPKEAFTFKGVMNKFKTSPKVNVELSTIKEKILPKAAPKSNNSRVESIRAKYSKLTNDDEKDSSKSGTKEQ